MSDNDTDVLPDITPEDFDGDKDTPKADSSPAEDKKPEVVEKPKEDEAKAEVEPEAKDAETEGEAEESEAEETAEPQGEDKTLKPKSENRFQSLANENRELRRQNEQLIAQVYQPATEDQLTEEVNPDTGENYSRLEAKFEAYRQQQEVEKFNNSVSEAQAEIGHESNQILQDFPVFNPDSDQFDEELHSEAADLLEANLIRDPNIPETGPDGKPTGQGIVIGSNVAPYKLYKTLARAQGISAAKGQMKGQQDYAKMSANADTRSSAAPPKKPKDPLAELWEGAL